MVEIEQPAVAPVVVDEHVIGIAGDDLVNTSPDARIGSQVHRLCRGIGEVEHVDVRVLGLGGIARVQQPPAVGGPAEVRRPVALSRTNRVLRISEGPIHASLLPSGESL